MTKQKESLPRDPRIRMAFKKQEFDFFFQWIAGSQTHGGAEVGEIFYTAAQIRGGDEEDWTRAWDALAERVEARAERSLASGHNVSARESYLRAYTYYRAPLLFISPLHEIERYRARYEKAQARFQKAAPLFDPPLERVEVPFEGNVLPGYFAKPAADDAPRKTLMMFGGGDTFAEDLYAYIVPAGLKRGYNVLFVDLPGQGMLPAEGMPMRADAEVPFSTVVDYALSRPDVDADQLVTYGISGGGYLVPRAVTVEKRVKACVACSLILDLSKVWDDDYVELHRRAEKSLIWRPIKQFMKWRHGTYFTMVDTYNWRWGTDNILDTVEVSKEFVIDPAEITCPLLNIYSEQEYAESGAMHGWAERAKEEVSHPNSKVVILPQDEGADSHAVGTNLSLMSQVVFDWLDEVLEAEA
ncbi:MAG: alpha/beta hydrolase family protein [Anaerolineae bacterium]